MKENNWQDNWQEDGEDEKLYFKEEETYLGDERPIIMVDEDEDYDSVIDVSDHKPTNGAENTPLQPESDKAEKSLMVIAPQPHQPTDDDEIGDEWLNKGSVVADRHRQMSEMAINQVRQAMRGRGMMANGLAVGRGDVTIEDIVRDSVKPYLKTWVDHNLESIVKEVMRRELARL